MGDGDKEDYSEAALRAVCETSLDPIAGDRRHIDQRASRDMALIGFGLTAVAQEWQVAYYQ
jgi:hypothetical protein